MTGEASPHINSKSEGNLPTIARFTLGTLSRDEFVENYQNPGIPVILTGLLSGKSRWDLEFLCQKLGSRNFLMRQYGTERYDQDKREWESIGSGVKADQVTFLEYAELLRSREAHEKDIYLAKCSIDETPLKQDIALQEARVNIISLGLDKPISQFNIWTGPGGHVECLHYDQMDGTLIQLYGTKKIVLFPRSQTPNLYPFSVFVHLYRGMKLRSWFSQLYPEKPDFQAFPNYRKALAHKREIFLAPGEILYIPAGWWHEVTALGDDMVCSINRFWRVYPTSRAILSWSRWRCILGTVFALPYVLICFIAAVFSRDRQQKFKEIVQMF